MQLESKVETMKHKPTILKKVIAYIPFITKYVFLYLFIYVLIYLSVSGLSFTTKNLCFVIAGTFSYGTWTL